MPGQVKKGLEKLGSDLRIARERRGESLRSWAQRLDVSVPTLQRLELGDPSVGMSVYATSIWLVGRSHELENLADPALDKQALALDIIKSSRKRFGAKK